MRGIGRRRHHQHVGGAFALALELHALMHAEAVLFVDHGEAKIAEAHVLGEDRVRADHDVDLARFECVRAWSRARGRARVR